MADQYEDNYIVGKDAQGHLLTHHVLAERLVCVEVAGIMSDCGQGDFMALTEMLENGFRGYHKMSSGELWAEWKDTEDKFYQLYEDEELPYSLCDEDPLNRTEVVIPTPGGHQ